MFNLEKYEEQSNEVAEKKPKKKLFFTRPWFIFVLIFVVAFYFAGSAMLKSLKDYKLDFAETKQILEPLNREFNLSDIITKEIKAVDLTSFNEKGLAVGFLVSDEKGNLKQIEESITLSENFVLKDKEIGAYVNSLLSDSDYKIVEIKQFEITSASTENYVNYKTIVSFDTKLLIESIKEITNLLFMKFDLKLPEKIYITSQSLYNLNEVNSLPVSSTMQLNALSGEENEKILDLLSDILSNKSDEGYNFFNLITLLMDDYVKTIATKTNSNPTFTQDGYITFVPKQAI